jgi:hypothetical protein
MAYERNSKRNRLDREHAPELTQSGGQTTTVLVEPFAEFGKSLEAQLLELEACYLLAGTPPRHIPNVAARRRMLG